MLTAEKPSKREVLLLRLEADFHRYFGSRLEYEVWKAKQNPVGSIVKFGNYLFVRIQITDGKWKDYKKLGKAPADWKAGDPLPKELEAGLPPEHQGAGKPAAEKPAEEPEAPEEMPLDEAPADFESFTANTKLAWVEGWKKKSPAAFDKLLTTLATAFHEKDPDITLSAGKGWAEDKISSGKGEEVFDALSAQGLLPGQKKPAQAAPGKAPAAAKPVKATTWKPAKKMPDLKGVLNIAEDHGSPGGATGAKKITYTAPDSSQHVGLLKPGGKPGKPSPGHAQEEHLANSIYAAMGYATHQSQMIDYQSSTAVLNDWIEGIQPVNALSGAEREAAIKEAQKGFALDALLANWDVGGAELDNVAWDSKTKTLYRIDNGGAGRYRARGSPKAEAFTDVVDEIHTMRDPNNVAGMLFSGLSDDEVANQIDQLEKGFGKVVTTLGDDQKELAKKLHTRLQSMKQWRDEHRAKATGKPALKLKPKRQAKPNGWPEPTAEEAAAVNYYKGSGYGTINPALRSHQLGGPGSQMRQTVDAIDSYVADTPVQDLKVYRSVGSAMAQNIFDGLGMPDFTLSAGNLGGKAPTGESWEEFFTDWLGGYRFADNGYMSTSKSQAFAKGWGQSHKTTMSATEAPHVMMAIAGKSRGIDFDGGYKGADSEHEVMLPRGTRMQVTAARPMKAPGGGIYLYLDVEIVQPKGSGQTAQGVAA